MKLLDEMEATAKNATPGPWRWHSDDTLISDSIKAWIILTSSSHNRTPFIAESVPGGCINRLDVNGPNAKFIIAANPENILKLCAMVREAENVIADAHDFALAVDRRESFQEAVKVVLKTGEALKKLRGEG